MKRIAGIITGLGTIALCWLLHHPMGSLPALGTLLDPVNGALANSEADEPDFNRQTQIKGFHSEVSIRMEDRLVPHIYATNNHDLYMAQGYVHAYFRLWQMDMQTRAAAGRISEVAGAKALAFDRGQRRKGMVYAAERSCAAMEADTTTRMMLDAYTEGVNAYIATLHFRDYPLEYKLMGFAPEPWTNLKCALLLKYMADDLTGQTDDFPLTLLRNQLGTATFNRLFPEHTSGSTPVIPSGTSFESPSLAPLPYPGDSVAITDLGTTATAYQPAENREDGIGSNNWAISGRHMAGGAATLCNDPHLGLNLPSLWYEVQLQAPGLNVYGVSLPGAPGVVIGFNDSISWGVTNNYRDVKDYYELSTTDKDHYLFDGQIQTFRQRIEVIRIKNAATVQDTVRYSLHGPVQYDASFDNPSGNRKLYAMCWMAHRPTNELKSLYLLNHAGSYAEFVAAIQYFACPAQNFAYADRHNNIAIWGQGQFVNKWNGQGRFVMEGKDRLSLWGADIPSAENPHALNPEQGYVASANQWVTDSTYPYWYNGRFTEFRSWAINRLLASPIAAQHLFTLEELQRLQNNTYSVLAAASLPAMLNGLGTGNDDAMLRELRSWNYELTADSKAASMFQVWWYYLHNSLWTEQNAVVPDFMPAPELTMLYLRADTGNTYATLLDSTYHKAADSLRRLSASNWYLVKNTSLTHLAKIPAFSYEQLPTGGWGNTINAMKQHNGPSWRMIVEMGKDSIHALGIYPGGQSGNPGSRYYASSIDQWTKGQYNTLLFLPNTPKQNSRAIRYCWMLGSKGL